MQHPQQKCMKILWIIYVIFVSNMLFTDAAVSLVNIDKSLFGMVEIVWPHLEKYYI